MSFLPFERMEQRVRTAFEDSDGEGLESLLLYGEFLLKLTVAGLLAFVKDDKDQTRYTIGHKLVRANGLGEWRQALAELLTGTARQFLSDEAREMANELNRRANVESWQTDFTSRINSVLTKVVPRQEKEGTGILSGWSAFVNLRNKTRAHGAITGGLKSEIAPDVRRAVETYAHNFIMFSLPWAFVKRNLSEKYRVSSLSRIALPESLTRLRTNPDTGWEDGVYIALGAPARVELAASDPDITNFFLPNGRFTNRGYEMLSYITGEHILGEADRFSRPPGTRPKSETRAGQFLDSDFAGGAVHNLPPAPSGYVPRLELEQSLQNALISPFPLISLVGRGGIGKTSLALHVLRLNSVSQQFDVVVWFSARDVDLTPFGPSQVQPDVLDRADIAHDFARLMSPYTGRESDPLDQFEQALQSSPFGGPILFVFDNFETVSNPRDLYLWLANMIRPPNKILITSRNRDFDRDYRITVDGMTAMESEEMAKRAARERGVEGKLTPQFIQSLHEVSGGHPYIIKVLVGEAAREGRFAPRQSILAPREDILVALFERTFSSLSGLARRVFLTLCSWNSPQSEICLEAVISHSTELSGVADAVNELEQGSLLETTRAEVDGTRFITVPLAGFLYGQSKLQASPDRLAVDADRKVLMMFGPLQLADFDKGTVGRVEFFLRRVLSQGSEGGKAGLRDFKPVLEFIANRVPSVWKLLSTAYEESQSERDLSLATQYMRRYLESSPDRDSARSAWERVAQLCRVQRAYTDEAHAVAEYCAIPSTWREKISDGMVRVAEIISDRSNNLTKPELQFFIQKIVASFEPHLDGASATELSRLAWLQIYLDDNVGAKRTVERGLSIENDNVHIRNLAHRLGIRAAG